VSEQHSSHSGACDGMGYSAIGSNKRFWASNAFQWRVGAVDNIRSDGTHPNPGVFKLLPTLQAHLVRPVLDRKHTTLVAVTTSEYEMENPDRRLHRSSARLRRSQLPLASNQASRARTLARARAIAQSAAP